ncbi:hypothetical protein AB0N17_45465 [Streptomyces sp. NPDC051133]|uniref:hypothetical protein n=1 Tax=Streptomyces sp. NPDC051133 TaxID=3155521 RepID=UPI0034160A1C
MVLGIAASPAAAAAVDPFEVQPNAACAGVPGVDFTVELRTDGNAGVDFGNGGHLVNTTTQSTTGPVVQFTLTGPYAARAVIIQGLGEPAPNGNTYLYNGVLGFPRGGVHDTGLHAVVNPQNDLYYIPDTVTYCVIPSSYNGSV